MRGWAIWILPVLLALMGAGIVGPASAQNSPQIEIDNANWTGADDLGRKLPAYEEVGDPKPDRLVGLFYWQWHGRLRCLPNDYNVTEFLKTHPGFTNFNAFPSGGPEHPTWYWAEPLFGYYKSTDPWVIRKHLIMIADAGVDFLFFDYTNSGIYDPELAVFLQVAKELKSKGVRVPKLAFFLNYKPEWKAEALYKTWYKPGRYDDMWFKWQGKPLMMSPMPTAPSTLKDPSVFKELQQYFTWRQTWALHDAQKEPTRWRFLDGHPQRPAKGPDGKIEQMVVSKSAGGPINQNMKSGSVSCVPGYEPEYNDQWVSKDCARGLFFQEQWKVAEEVAAPILLVTGWNEWTASVWNTKGVPFLGRISGDDKGYFVDEFNMEFNRDLEPMKDGYFDNYYMQLVANMRRYKGMHKPEAPSALKPVTIDGSFDDWKDVRPIFKDAIGDIAIRDFDGTVPNSHYIDKSARNDIVLAQVVADSTQIYFHAKTAALLSPSTDKNWMLLLIDSDSNISTGWYGYDYLINRIRNGNRCSIERNVGGRWQWKKLADVPARWNGCDIELSIRKELIGKFNDVSWLAPNFKWIDNTPDIPTIADFYCSGDAAPDGRFNYRFEIRPDNLY